MTLPPATLLSPLCPQPVQLGGHDTRRLHPLLDHPLLGVFSMLLMAALEEYSRGMQGDAVTAAMKERGHAKKR